MKPQNIGQEREINARFLATRIQQNRGAQQRDLNTWIFERLHVDPRSNVLELCCGTGAQTVEFVKRCGEHGHVTAMDRSAEAVEMIQSRLSVEKRRYVTALQGDMDEFPVLLPSLPSSGRGYDLIFCSYGLYYSADPAALLRRLQSFLAPGGRMAVVGPYGDNNHQLFELLRASGVGISDYIMYTSRDFMEDLVIPWGAAAFERVDLHTLVNPVAWESAEQVMTYWSSSTFYDSQRADRVAVSLDEHFQNHSVFQNDKCIMLAEMSHARA